jgi:hypothetical protein
MAGLQDVVDEVGGRPLAETVTAPSSILIAGAATAGTILATSASLPFIGLGLLVGAGVWGITTAVKVGRLRGRARRRDGRDERIDPFAIGEPWRRYVQEAQTTKARFQEAVGRTRQGPLREHLQSISERLDDAVRECWEIARQGHAMQEAARHVDVAGLKRNYDEANVELRNASADRQEVLQSTLRSVQSSLESAQRLSTVTQSTQDRLRQLDAQMDELVVRAVELSATATTVDDFSSLRVDTESLVTDMEALRQAVDETRRVATA